MKRKSTLITLLVIWMVTCIQVGYTQTETKVINPNQVPLYYNPAFTGSLDQARVALTYRRQWAAIPGSPSFGYASWDAPIAALKGGIGGMAYYERLGPFDNFGFGVTYSPKFKLGDQVTLAPAIGAQMVSSSFNIDPLNLPIWDPVLPRQDTSIWYPDFRVGGFT